MHQLFTVLNADRVLPGLTIETRRSKSGDRFPIVQVGETGRGRHLSWVPCKLSPGLKASWQADGAVVAGVQGCALSASLEMTKAGKPLLVMSEKNMVGNTDHALVKIMTGIPYRGGNFHTGLKTGGRYLPKSWQFDYKEATGLDYMKPVSRQQAEEAYPLVKAELAKRGLKLYGLKDLFKEVCDYAPFPGQILVDGWEAHGKAGRCGSGKEVIALIPKGEWVRVGRTDRYNAIERELFFRFDGEKIETATAQDMELLAKKGD